MRPVYRGLIPTITTSRGQQAQTSEEYGYFMKSLVQRIGEYCSYCEVPLGANLAVEHIISKSKAPAHEANWNNFILACTNCNSSKGNVVDFSNLADYYWPSDTSYNIYSKFTYYLDTDGYAKIKPATTGDTRAIATIALTKLNRFNPNDTSKNSDRRVFNRTAAWRVADDLGNRLASYYVNLRAAADTDPAVRLLKNQIQTAAVARGFWSVWMTLFSGKSFVDDATRDNLLCELFVQPFAGTNYPIGTYCSTIVPGTYSDGLPH